jgi:hypothetical protein
MAILVLGLVIFLGLWGYPQVSLNALWRSEAEPLPGGEPLPVLPDTMPPRLEDEQSPQTEQPPPDS